MLAPRTTCDPVEFDSGAYGGQWGQCGLCGSRSAQAFHFSEQPGRSVFARCGVWFVVAALVLAIAAGISGTEAESGELATQGMRVGDCFDAPADEAFSSVAAVPCHEAHDFEAFHSFQLPDGAFPTRDVFRTSMGQCLRPFARYVGVPYGESAIDFNLVTPTEQSWTMATDRTVLCVLFDPSGPLVTSATSNSY